ncbi:MAG TPA: ester cyclase [Ktedonobacteraceae bacterium]
MRLLFAEALCQGQLALIDSLFSADFIDHSTPEQEPGHAGVKAYFRALRSGFPDLQVSIEDLITQGEKIAVRTYWRGTHLGIYEGIAPDGRVSTRTLIQIFRLANGLIAEEWNAGAGLLDGERP